MGLSINTRVLLEYEDNKMLIKREEGKIRLFPLPWPLRILFPFSRFGSVNSWVFIVFFFFIFEILAQGTCFECVWHFHISSVFCCRADPLSGPGRWLSVSTCLSDFWSLQKPGMVAPLRLWHSTPMGGGNGQISGSLCESVSLGYMLRVQISERSCLSQKVECTWGEITESVLWPSQVCCT